ncbi:MAG: endolytic transglycosylase MltG [Prevotella sp.]|nr:endolytic transglycosylase MltG [Prevotella sp.]MCM1075138.1 endolytic transglycosylase MltG [Ruminococcus sp.]
MNATKYCAEHGKSKLNDSSLEEFSNTEKKPKRRRKFNRGLVWTFFIILLALIITSLFLVLPLVNKKAGRSAIIRIPLTATEQSIEDSIAKYLGEDYAKSCSKAMRLIRDKDDQRRHGAYEIKEGMTPFAAGRQILRGGQAGIDVSLNGQRTKEDVARLFAAKLEASEKDFLDMLNDGRLLETYNTDPDHVLCMFFEDTYEFFWTATPEEVLKKMSENYKDFWTPERVERAEELNRLPRGIVMIASIVDEETNQASEKGTIGRLYLNRLDKNMRLQADPTVKYAWRTDPALKNTVNVDSIKRITSKYTGIDNPFNTYKQNGLPPGPIRITSKQTVDAILSARPHDYIYMCASDKMDGTHNFAVTFEEHQQNSKRYQKALDGIGITVNSENEKVKD